MVAPTEPEWRPYMARTSFSSPHLCKGGENGPPRGFLQLSPETAMLFSAMLFSPFGCTHPSPPFPPFLLVQNLSPKDIACWKWHHKLKVVWCINTYNRLRKYSLVVVIISWHCGTHVYMYEIYFWSWLHVSVSTIIYHNISHQNISESVRH